MKGLCGSDAAEVFRRMQILKSDNMDVVCELRRENPKYCRYERQKRHIDADPQDRIASPSSLHEKSETEAMYNVVRAVPMDTVKNLELKQQGLSGIIDSDNVKLRKRLSIAEEPPIRIENGFKLFKRFGFQEDFHPSSDVAEINRLRSLAENDHLSDIHRIGYASGFQYKDTSYPGGYDNPGLVGPENLSEDQQKEFISTEPLYSGSTQFIIKQQDSDSQDHKNSEPPKKEKSRNDRKTETKEDPINNIKDKDDTTVFILRLKKNQEAALDEERFRREAEIARVNRDKRRNKEILRVAYGCKLNKLNEEARDLERKIEAVRKQIDETRQNQQRIVEEYEALERQRKEQYREFLQMQRENLLTREKEKAIYLKHEEL